MIRIIGSVVVTYNPDIKLLYHNISILKKQVNLIVIVDNNSFDRKVIQNRYQSDDRVIIIANAENYGIAKALNQGFDILHNSGIIWGISFDQDSECPNNLVQEALPYLNDNEIGILSPLVYDKNINVLLGKKNDTNNINYVDRCISSGAITNLVVWKKINGFDEGMFIDYVDFDYSIRVRKENYKIVKLSNVIMQHELGNCTYKKFFGYKIRISNHSSLRKYYMGRNMVYFIKKHKCDTNIPIEFLRIVKIPIIIILFEKSKKTKLISFFYGVRDGIKMKI